MDTSNKQNAIRPLSQQTNPYPKLTVDCPAGNFVRLGRMEKVRGSIVIKGAGNVVEVLDNSLLDCAVNIHGDNNRVLIGSHCAIRGRILVKGKGQTVSVGDHTTFQSVYILAQESCDVNIGRWCMFSREIEIRTTDAHSVIDMESGLRLNAPSSICIGDHVWISVGALVSKGSRIPTDTIVGAKAFVNGAFEESNTIIAGGPAKVVKRGVTWNRNRRAQFTPDEMFAWRTPAPTSSEL